MRQSLFFFVENNELNVDSAKLGELHGLLDKALLSLIVSDVPRVWVLDVIHRIKLSPSHDW